VKGNYLEEVRFEMTPETRNGLTACGCLFQMDGAADYGRHDLTRQIFELGCTIKEYRYVYSLVL